MREGNRFYCTGRNDTYGKSIMKRLRRLKSLEHYRKDGRSFDSARGTIRGFKKRLRKRNVKREDIIA